MEKPIDIEVAVGEGSCGAVEPFALQVLGSDMEPEFRHGHIIIVDPGGTLRDGCFVVAKHAEAYIFRQLRMQENDLTLTALEPGHPEISLKSQSEIIGVVTQRSGRRRKEHKRYD